MGEKRGLSPCHHGRVWRRNSRCPTGALSALRELWVHPEFHHRQFPGKGERRWLMTDYHDVWGGTAKSWCKIDPRDNLILAILTVVAWMGMIAFFVFGGFSLLTNS